jgi:polyisoprenoid-binding protein YceI
MLTAGFLGALLTGCPVRAPPPAPQPAVPAAPQAPVEAPAAHLGRPYDIVPQESLLTILVFRAGTLASAGHNHLIASHSLSGTIYVPQELAAVSFEVHVPLAELSVDEEALRAAEMNRDFPPQVSDTAKEGTRRNMLGSALLNAADYPQITLRTLSVVSAADGMVQVRVQAEVRGQQRVLLVPVRYEHSDSTVTASGELPVTQSSLGLTPFSAMLGALQVQDEMRVRFRIVARDAKFTSRPSPPAARWPCTPCAAPRG